MPAVSNAVAQTDTEPELEASSVIGISLSPEPGVGSKVSMSGGQEGRDDGEGDGMGRNGKGDGETRLTKKRRKLVEVDFTGYTPVANVKLGSSDGARGGRANAASAIEPATERIQNVGKDERRAMLRNEAELMRRALEEKERELDALD